MSYLFWKQFGLGKYHQLVLLTTSLQYVLLKHLNPPNLPGHHLKALPHQTLMKIEEAVYVISISTKTLKKMTILIKYSSIALTRKDQSILHAVHGNPPSIATGRVGAVGQIHFICNVNRFIR